MNNKIIKIKIFLIMFQTLKKIKQIILIYFYDANYSFYNIKQKYIKKL